MYTAAVVAIRDARTDEDEVEAVRSAVVAGAPPRVVADALGLPVGELTGYLTQRASVITLPADFRPGDVIVAAASQTGRILWAVSEPFRRAAFADHAQMRVTSSGRTHTLAASVVAAMVPAQVLRAG